MRLEKAISKGKEKRKERGRRRAVKGRKAEADKEIPIASQVDIHLC